MFDLDMVIYFFFLKLMLLSIDEKVYYCEKIKCLLKECNVVMVVYYYIDFEI